VAGGRVGHRAVVDEGANRARHRVDIAGNVHVDNGVTSDTAAVEIIDLEIEISGPDKIAHSPSLSLS
jgi:hypothetical protein